MLARTTRTIKNVRAFIDDEDGVGLFLLVFGLLLAGMMLWVLIDLFWRVPGLFFTVLGLAVGLWIMLHIEVRPQNQRDDDDEN
jgi:hypothetical protein